MSGTTKTTLLAQMWPTRHDVLGTRPNSSFGASTFVGLRAVKPERILSLGKLRLEDVASGYWTLFAKQSSGLVSHYGSTPSSSARPLDFSNSREACLAVL